MTVLMVTPLGQRIVRLRAERGWTQGQLAAYARVKRSWLSLVESGDRERPNADDLVRVARALGTTVEYLVTGQTEDVEPEKEAILRRLASRPTDVLARFERAVGAFFSEEPPKREPDSDTEGKRQEQREDDAPAADG